MIEGPVRTGLRVKISTIALITDQIFNLDNQENGSLLNVFSESWIRAESSDRKIVTSIVTETYYSSRIFSSSDNSVRILRNLILAYFDRVSRTALLPNFTTVTDTRFKYIHSVGSCSASFLPFFA